MNRFAPLIIFCWLAIMGNLASASEENQKPTRQEILAFLEECREKMPLTEEEKGIAWSKREKIDLVKRFGNNFTELDLSEINFRPEARGIMALGADFSYCNLRDINFGYAVLSGCRFVGADLKNTLFFYSNLENTDFTDARLGKTRFHYSEMANANFAGLKATTSEFPSVKFQGARLSGTDFSGVDFEWNAKFQNADITGANLSYTSLSYSDFTGATLKDVRLKHADLYLANFTGADLEGTDFTDANLKYALFAEVKGIDESQRDALEHRAVRWRYDLKEGFQDFLEAAYIPVYLVIAISVFAFSLIGLLKKSRKTPCFIIAVFLNAFAFFSTFTTFLMMFSGGYPVKQMSQGNWNAWSQWLHFYPIPLFGLMLCILLAIILSFVVTVRLIWKRSESRPWALFSYQVLTLVHCLIAFNWLLMFMPDA